MDTLKDVYYWFYRLWKYKIMVFHKEVKWFIQRGRRGYADCDVWDFHSYLSGVISGGLYLMAGKSYGCPSAFYNESNIGNECYSWHKELSEIAQGFKDYEHIVLNDGLLDEMVYGGHNTIWDKNGIRNEPPIPQEKYDTYNKMIEEEKAKFDKIMVRFSKIYGNLWD